MACSTSISSTLSEVDPIEELGQPQPFQEPAEDRPRLQPCRDVLGDGQRVDERLTAADVGDHLLQLGSSRPRVIGHGISSS
jgi:hypothetical protein